MSNHIATLIFRKLRLKKKVTEMLSVSLIRLNHNPFSSSILLVKKKDDNWHFCVDYKALDAITIKDCFPMSMMDELLDKLGTTS